MQESHNDTTIINVSDTGILITFCFLALALHSFFGSKLAVDDN